MPYTNARWGYELDLPASWRLRAENEGQPEFNSGSASLKIATGPVPMGRRAQDELEVLRKIAAKYGHRVISDGLITVDGIDHATVTCNVPRVGILKTYGLIFLDREFLITGGGELAACDAAVRTFRLIDRGSGEPAVIQQLIRRAEGEDPDAQFTLGLHYHDCGDQDKAFRWILRAAKGGHPIAQMNVGACYTNGEGTPVDGIEAMKWLLLSAQSGYRAAGPALESMRSQLRTDQINEATRRAGEWQTGAWSLDDARRYLKSAGDLKKSGCAAQALVLLAILSTVIAFCCLH